MTDVDTMPPSRPRLVRVTLDSMSPSRTARPLRTLAARRAPFFGGVGSQVVSPCAAKHRHQQAGVGLHGNADKHSRVPRDHARLVVEARVHLRTLAHGQHQRIDDLDARSG
jgi:hypothetical protein